jgi:hypothetical protein
LELRETVGSVVFIAIFISGCYYIYYIEKFAKNVAFRFRNNILRYAFRNFCSYGIKSHEVIDPGISYLRVHWKTLPDDFSAKLLIALQRTLPLMKEQESSNCISSLGRLGINWHDLPVELQRLIEETSLRALTHVGAKGCYVTRTSRA